MTFVGKIFVLLIFVMSLVFMSFAVMVYATHRNWYALVENDRTARPPGLKVQLEDRKREVEAAQAVRARHEAEIADEKSARIREVAKLTTQVEELKQQRDELQKNEAKLKQSVDDSVAAMTAAQNTLADLRKEISDLRELDDKVRKERDDKLAESVKLEEQLAQSKGELDRLTKRAAELAKDVAQYSNRMQEEGIPLETKTPRVEGVVLAVNANGLLEISIGADDGLLVGHELDVFRIGADTAAGKYLGRVKVVKTDVDRAVARLIPETRKGPIQVDDRVATKLDEFKQANRKPGSK